MVFRFALNDETDYLVNMYSIWRVLIKQVPKAALGFGSNLNWTLRSPFDMSESPSTQTT